MAHNFVVEDFEVLNVQMATSIKHGRFSGDEEAVFARTFVMLVLCVVSEIRSDGVQLESVRVFGPQQFVQVGQPGRGGGADRASRHRAVRGTRGDGHHAENPLQPGERMRQKHRRL